MNLYDHEPIAVRAADQTLTPARLAATAAAALPAVGFGLLCVFRGFFGLRVTSADGAFQVMLGTSLLVLFADVAVFIKRSRHLHWILLAGVLGFAGSFGAAVLADIGGSPVLMLVMFVAGTWALLISRSHPARRRR